MIIRRWEHAGMDCAISHGIFGCPCGYVRVPEGHPLHGKSAGRADERVDAYGGVTFAGTIDGEGWWIGFDTAHIGDIDPDGMRPLRSDDFCARRTDFLAGQLAHMAGGAE